MDKRQKRGKQILTGLLICGVLFSLSVASLREARAVDLSKEGSLQVKLVDNQDVKDAKVVYDLYKVAGISSMRNRDEIDFAVDSAFSSIKNEVETIAQCDTEALFALSQKAANIALAGDSKAAKLASKQMVDRPVDKLYSGVYLLVAYGEDIENPVVEKLAEDGSKKLVTYAETPSKTYYFMPQLVVLPGIDGDKEEFLFDLEVSLKSEFENRLGRLEIKKKLLTYVEDENTDFIFQIEAYNSEKKEQKVYSNVVAISFKDAREDSVVLDQLLPIGSYVEVTEVYTGSKYSLVSDATQTTVIPREGTGLVEFTNDYDEEKKSGGAVVNRFEYDENGGWNWTQE